MKNKKGFTLIELLAVIVILGLLLAIAIPSITKYINQSRRKTLVSSIDGYISSVINDVNDGEYSFSTSNVIYAIPSGCVFLEKGGSSPFGEWSPVSDDYWAYVLVQYNPEDFSYTYGFTFKDSSGYGMYPTEHSQIDQNSSVQIKTGLNLTKPISGLYTSITSKDNWTGFIVNNDTRLIVLDNNTCTIPKPCTGEGSEIGNVVTCGSESFYIIEKNSSKITMLTKEKINLNINNPVQNKNAASIGFADATYWMEGNKVKEIYKNNYVYDENSKVYEYVEAYEIFLQNKLMVLSADAKLISYSQLVNNLGCTSNNCNNSPYDWIGKTYMWWSGTATYRDNLWYIYSYGTVADNGNIWRPCAVRPVVTLSESEIEFN